MSSSEDLLPTRLMICLEILCLTFNGRRGPYTSRNAFLAGIKSTVVETQRAEHAKEIVTGLSLSELQSFDGFVAVRSCPKL